MNGYREDKSQIKVMVVDDSLAFRRLLKRMLESTGYLVEEVEDGKIAVSKYAQVLPDVVLMDITMPEMKGTVAMDVIRRNHADAKVIMITSLGHKDLVEDCVKLGAKGYILKPISDDQVPKVLQMVKKVALED